MHPLMSVCPTQGFMSNNVQNCDNIYTIIRIEKLKINIFRMAPRTGFNISKAPRTNEKKETRQENREMTAELEKNRE